MGVDAPDLVAAQVQDDKRSRVKELKHVHPRESFVSYRKAGVCPDLFLDWCRPDDSRPPTWPSGPGMGSSRSRLRTLGMAAMVLNLAGGR